MARSSSNFFESSSIQSSDERIEASQFSTAILERETSTQIEEELPCTSCKDVISGSSVHLSSYRNYRWGDSSSIFPQTWPQK